MNTQRILFDASLLLRTAIVVFELLAAALAASLAVNWMWRRRPSARWRRSSTTP